MAIDIITSIILGMVSNASYDSLKTTIKKVSKHKFMDFMKKKTVDVLANKFKGKSKGEILDDYSTQIDIVSGTVYDFLKRYGDSIESLEVEKLKEVLIEAFKSVSIYEMEKLPNVIYQNYTQITITKKTSINVKKTEINIDQKGSERPIGFFNGNYYNGKDK